MKSILITGNMGYIGPCVVTYLRTHLPNSRLTGLDTGYFAANLLDSVLPEHALDEQRFGDVRGIAAGDLAGVDAIIHLAAISNDPMGNAYEKVTEDINYQGTLAVARAARAAGVRHFVFASSCSVYGFAEDGARNEQSVVNPLTAYARSKVASEQSLAELAGPNFIVTCLRFATACGASPRLRLDLVLNDFVASAVTSGVIKILSDGTPWRPLIDVEDMARAFHWAIDRTASNGGAFLVVNAGSNVWNYQIRELAEAVAQTIPGVTVDINKNAAPDKRSYRVDFSLFASLAPNHQPQVTLDEAIAELKALLESTRFSDANFRQSCYMRLNMLSQLIAGGPVGFKSRLGRIGMAHQPLCRFCSIPLKEVFADLGVSPLANSYLREDQLSNMEPHYPLKAWVCGSCMLVQLEEFESPAGIFSEYAYFSSFSTSWLAHAERYVQHMIARFGFDSKSQVIEIASNDGYLLQYFQAAGVPVLGIEPAANVAQAAIAKGIPSRTVFFGRDTASDLKADLLIGNNVYAHVPDLHSFTEGLQIALKPDGIITLEFPHLLRLMDDAQFDTIYHEHFSYLSLLTVQQIFTRHWLTVFDVEELPTHGGSLRIFGRHSENTSRQITPRVESLVARERAAGLDRLDAYRSFTEKVKRVKCDILAFLIQARREGKSVVGYGAPAKGNTLLNYCGIGPELLSFTVDRSPHKQGQYLPGTRIPIYPPEAIEQAQPDYVLLLPWNLKDEITEQMKMIRNWGGRFVVAIPSLEVLA